MKIDLLQLNLSNPT